MPLSPTESPEKTGESKTVITSKNMTVVKRSGVIVPFQEERISNAVEAAVRDTYKKEKKLPLSDELVELIDQVTTSVIEALIAKMGQGEVLTVEGIQDIVEKKLMETGHHEVAKDYIIYRDQHKHLRELKETHPQVLRSDKKTIVRFNPIKIGAMIEKAFRVTFGIEGPTPANIIETVNQLTLATISNILNRDLTRPITTEEIQEQIENDLMAAGYFKPAKYVILERSTKPEYKVAEAAIPKAVKKTFSLQKIVEEIFTFATEGFDVKPKELIDKTLSLTFEGINEKETYIAAVMAVKEKIEIEPMYAKIAACILLDSIYRETLASPGKSKQLESIHVDYFIQYMQSAKTGDSRLDPRLADFDLKALAQALDLKRDRNFSYLGLQTLYDRYFIHKNQRRLETPQIFWMRVAMGLALNEKEEKTQRAIEFYNTLSQFQFLSSTPTLFNAGTKHPQLSSCYLSTVGDDLHSIFKVISNDAQLSKWAGGIGNDWTPIRATGSLIKGTNGSSQGVIPFLKIVNDTAVAVNQCFAPETSVYTSQGAKPISEIQKGDLVLGISGTYREVEETYAYNQQDAMVSIEVEHSMDPISVTAGHPFYAIQGESEMQCNWVEAGSLQEGDYIAQVIPQEVVVVPEFDEEDARLYGILLGNGRFSNEGTEREISASETHAEFIRSYLGTRNIPYQETKEGSIRWNSSQAALRDATNGRSVSSGEPTLPFEYEDFYDEKGNKRIAPRLAHLPRKQTLAMMQGLLASDGKEITFSHPSKGLTEDVRYQCLRLGVPTSGKGSYELKIPATGEIAEKVGCKPVTNKNWLEIDGRIFTRVQKVKPVATTPFVYDLKVKGDESYMTVSALAHNGGKRKGAACVYLETWHLDIEDFMELRKNTGDERRRTHDMNTANWIPDLFMKRVMKQEKWTLFSPSDTPDLHDLYGQAFEKRYLAYEKQVQEGKLKLFKEVEAQVLWRKMLSMLFETGHPWITFKDPCNIRSPQDHVGVVHSSNLCTEITLNSSLEETAVCNIGSVNLAVHTNPEGLDKDLLKQTVRTAMRMLDNVIDINFYPIEEAETSNRRHRPVGIGLMGFQDSLYIQNISYASHEAIEFSDVSMELISYFAIEASSDLAKEKGSYSTFKGSKWDKGILPIDSQLILKEERGEYIELNENTTLDWQTLRDKIKTQGMRNSNTMAIAPTATIANIADVTASIEPPYKHLFVKSNLSGEFTIINPYLVSKLKELNLWDEEMIDDLKYFDGHISEIQRIPQEIKNVFLTAFDIEPEWLIECAARRQKWIDMAQSLNLYLNEPSGKKMHNMYFFAWKKGLKTTYYARTLGATQIEKSSSDINKRGVQPRWMKNTSASSEIAVVRDQEKPKACSLQEGCESCQ